MGASPDEEVLTLRTQLQRWAEAYFERDAPVVPDADYDQAMRRLQALEQAFPDLVTPDSPTQRVGSAPLSEFESVEHRLPMLSLDNAFSAEDLGDFHRRVTERLGVADVTYCCEPKLDGVAVISCTSKALWCWRRPAVMAQRARTLPATCAPFRMCPWSWQVTMSLPILR